MTTANLALIWGHYHLVLVRLRVLMKNVLIVTIKRGVNPVMIGMPPRRLVRHNAIVLINTPVPEQTKAQAEQLVLINTLLVHAVALTPGKTELVLAIVLINIPAPEYQEFPVVVALLVMENISLVLVNADLGTVLLALHLIPLVLKEKSLVIFYIATCPDLLHIPVR